jgi:hypothetical protein
MKDMLLMATSTASPNVIGLVPTESVLARIRVAAHLATPSKIPSIAHQNVKNASIRNVFLLGFALALKALSLSMAHIVLLNAGVASLDVVYHRTIASVMKVMRKLEESVNPFAMSPV